MYYAGTEDGLYRIHQEGQIENFASWEKVGNSQGIPDDTDDRRDRAGRDREERRMFDGREVRTYDGTNNNIDNASWGATFIRPGQLAQQMRAAA